MTKYVVLWTNRKQTIIVSIMGGVEKIVHVESSAKGRGQEKWSHHLGEYYRKVINAIQDAQEIFILGPAQAKMELKIEILKSESLSYRIMGTETVDTMTESELVARARQICGSEEN